MAVVHLYLAEGQLFQAYSAFKMNLLDIWVPALHFSSPSVSHAAMRCLDVVECLLLGVRVLFATFAGWLGKWFTDFTLTLGIEEPNVFTFSAFSHFRPTFQVIISSSLHMGLRQGIICLHYLLDKTVKRAHSHHNKAQPSAKEQ